MIPLNLSMFRLCIGKGLNLLTIDENLPGRDNAEGLNLLTIDENLPGRDNAGRSPWMASVLFLDSGQSFDHRKG